MVSDASQLLSQLPSGLREGDIVAGKYRIDGILGSGAMGVVVVAGHLMLGEKVAIKFLLPQALGNGDASARFLREAQTAVRIKSEHVARVFDVATLEDGTPYIVMEYLQGSDLAAILQQHGPLPVEQAVEFILQACEAIAEAHELGIVHRDLKPANLFVVRRADGLYAIKVLDFGISKTLNDGADGRGVTMTDTMVVMGSPAYMSPEQMESARKVDSQTDVWALGAILCELVTGRIPFDGHSLPEVYTKIVSHPQPSIREWAPGLPVGLEDVILKCLRTNRKLRYRDVGDLAAAISEYGPRRAGSSVDRIARTLEASRKANPEPLGGPPWSPLTVAAGTIAEKTLHSWGDPAPATVPSPPRRALRRRWLLASAGAAVLLAITAVLATRPLRRPAEPPAASSVPVSASLAASAPASGGGRADEGKPQGTALAPRAEPGAPPASSRLAGASAGEGAPAEPAPADETRAGPLGPRPHGPAADGAEGAGKTGGRTRGGDSTAAGAPPRSGELPGHAGAHAAVAGAGAAASSAAARPASPPPSDGTQAPTVAASASAPDLGSLDLADPK